MKLASLLRSLPGLILIVLALPSWALQTPQTFTLRYEATLSSDPKRQTGLARLLGEGTSMGHFEDQVSLKPGSYRIESIGKVTGWVATFLKGDTWHRTSEGKLVRSGLQVTRFTEQRGRPGLTAVDINYAKKTATFHRDQNVLKQEPISGRVFDSANLPYVFLGKPMPKAAFTLSVIDGKSVKLFTFEATSETIEVQGASVPVIKLTRRIVQPDDATYELWLRPADGMPLRTRIGASVKYGIILEQKLQALPPVLK